MINKSNIFLGKVKMISQELFNFLKNEKGDIPEHLMEEALKSELIIAHWLGKRGYPLPEYLKNLEHAKRAREPYTGKTIPMMWIDHSDLPIPEELRYEGFEKDLCLSCGFTCLDYWYLRNYEGDLPEYLNPNKLTLEEYNDRLTEMSIAYIKGRNQISKTMSDTLKDMSDKIKLLSDNIEAETKLKEMREAAKNRLLKK